MLEFCHLKPVDFNIGSRWQQRKQNYPQELLIMHSIKVHVYSRFVNSNRIQEEKQLYLVSLGLSFKVRAKQNVTICIFASIKMQSIHAFLECICDVLHQPLMFNFPCWWNCGEQLRLFSISGMWSMQGSPLKIWLCSQN